MALKPLRTRPALETDRLLARVARCIDMERVDQAEKLLQLILRFDLDPATLPAGRVLSFEDLHLPAWDRRVTPQSLPQLPPLPVFSTAAARPGLPPPEDLNRKAEEVMERLLPRWVEGIRAELLEELKRNPPRDFNSA